MLVQFTLPLPPSVNNQYVTVGNRRMLSREAQAYKRTAKSQIEQLQRRQVIPPAFIAQAAAGFEDLLGKRTGGVARVGGVLPARWME